MFSWQVDEWTWVFGGTWLLLITAVLLTLSYQTKPAFHWRSLTPALLLGLGAILPFMAGNLSTLLTGWVVLVVFWGVAGAMLGDTVAALYPKLAWMLFAVPFLWLAAVFSPTQTGWEMETWPLLAKTAVFAAAFLQLGVWQGRGWRPATSPPPGLMVLMHTAPALAGTVLLTRLVAGSQVGQAYGLLATVCGLISLLVGIQRMWANLNQPLPFLVGLSLAQTSLVWLVGVWADGAAVAAEARVMLLAVSILFLTADFSLKLSDSWRVVAPLVALGAVAGLPLTAGFAGRAALYTAWLENGRWALVLVMVLLSTPLVTALFLYVRGRFSAEFGSPRPFVQDAAALLPVAGLFSVGGFSGASPVAWVAILLPIVVGGVLARFLGEATDLQETVLQAFRLDAIGSWRSVGKTVVAGLGTAVHEAALILEGEGGLLWLLLLLVIFLIGV